MFQNRHQIGWDQIQILINNHDHTKFCLSFQLSVQSNQLIRMFQVAKLSHLKILNLAHNHVVTMEGLKELKLLTWLSLAANNIKAIEHLNQNVHLEHLDLSDNAITTVADISYLKNLKVRYLLINIFVMPFHQ
eukprot:TCALIF_02018-PA protein Name:"Similar to Cep97 Centrosomal protein of 97 kDa (Mus musculus)" AED:0.12 eAED:0.12 QI:0/-1/0/1/-1/1/1/0/132